MPVIKSAKKKLRIDKKREVKNSILRLFLKKTLKKAAGQPTLENIRIAVKAVDKAAKNNLIHKNKAARIKSKLSKLIKPSPKKVSLEKTTKTKSSKAKK